MNTWQEFVAHYRRNNCFPTQKLSFALWLEIFDAYCDWKRERKAA